MIEVFVFHTEYTLLAVTGVRQGPIEVGVLLRGRIPRWPVSGQLGKVCYLLLTFQRTFSELAHNYWCNSLKVG